MGVDCGSGAGGAVSTAPALVFEKRARWCDEAQRGLSQTFGHDREAIIESVNAGRFELWKIEDGNIWMVTRVDRGVLTVCCLQGRGLPCLAPILYRIAQRSGMHAIEYWSKRPALARALKRAGFMFRPQETAYRCEVLREH